MVITGDPCLDNFYQELQKTDDPSILIKSLKQIINGGTNKEEEEFDPKLLSSPEDSRLINRKKAKGKKRGIKPPEMFADNIQQCEEGMSPKLTFSRKKKNIEEDDSD